jgi:hypothetical protein
VGSYRAYVEKCGWKVEGVNRKHIFRDGAFMDQLRVAALKSDFDQVPEASAYVPVASTQRVKIRSENWAGSLDDAGEKTG